MDAEKYRRSVSLICPTCGCDQFEYDGNAETGERMKCAKCLREFTREQLIEMNRENVSEHVEEMKQEIMKDVAKEFRETLRKSFVGSKSIKLR
jgi:uncharacterized Zn finger protein (UPF0148 family)